MYCPYGLGISVPAMMVGHLTVFGLAEVIFTVAVFAVIIFRLIAAMMKERTDFSAEEN